MKLVVKVSFSLLMFLSSISLAGGQSGGGGNDESLQFVRIGSKIADALWWVGQKNVDVNISKFQNALAHTTVQFTYNLSDQTHDNSQLVAYRPEVSWWSFGKPKLIRVDIRKWYALDDSPAEKVRIALHEYLGTMKLEGSEAYGLTNKLIAAIEAKGIQIEILVPQIDYSKAISGMWVCVKNKDDGSVPGRYPYSHNLQFISTKDSLKMKLDYEYSASIFASYEASGNPTPTKIMTYNPNVEVYDQGHGVNVFDGGRLVVTRLGLTHLEISMLKTEFDITTDYFHPELSRLSGEMYTLTCDRP